MDIEFFVSQDGLLFPRKWDRSRWELSWQIDRRLDTIKVRAYGVGGPDHEVIVFEGPLERPCASWDHVFEHACTNLRDQLEFQLDDSL